MKALSRITLLSVFFLTGCGTVTGAFQQGPARAVHYMNDLTSSNDVPGIQYVVVSRDSTLFDHVSGLADIRRGVPLRPSTTMMAYSMTKTFTAAAILQLCSRGLCSIDDPVAEYLPYIPYGPELTIRDLITQTSGIPNPIPLRWAHLVEEHSGYDENEFLQHILDENPDLNFTPGDEYSYSNISSWLLGKIIEVVSGLEYTEYMRIHILEELAIPPEEADFIIPNRTNHAKGYLARWTFINLFKSFVMDSKFFGEYEDGWLRIYDHYLNGPAFGGLVSSARASALFLQDQLRDSSVLFDARTHVFFFEQHQANDGDLVPMTPGWHIGELDGMRYYFKEGGGGGFHSEMRIYPGFGIGTVVLANSTTFDSGDFLDDLDPMFSPDRQSMQ